MRNFNGVALIRAIGTRSADEWGLLMLVPPERTSSTGRKRSSIS
ncbi:MAG: hypothetical protein ACFNYI_00590 [Eubacterium sp.]